MAKVEDLPIYRVTYNLLEESIKATKNFPKDFKISLANKINDECIDLVSDVYRANSSRDKEMRIKYINNVLERVEILNLLFRLCKDLQYISSFSNKQYSNLIYYLDQIGKQAQGWKKQTSKNL